MKRIVQVGYLQRLYRDVQSTEHKIKNCHFVLYHNPSKRRISSNDAVPLRRTLESSITNPWKPHSTHIRKHYFYNPVVTGQAIFYFCIVFQVWDNEAEDTIDDVGQEQEESQKNGLMDFLVCSIVILSRTLFGDYQATNNHHKPSNNTLLLV